MTVLAPDPIDARDRALDPVSPREVPLRGVWALRLSGFSVLPLVVFLHPSFNLVTYFGTLFAIVVFVPFERLVERRFFTVEAPVPAIVFQPPRLHLVERDPS